MSDKELIDPLNPDTYDERVIVHSGIRSVLSGPAFEKMYADSPSVARRKDLLQEIRHFKLLLWRWLYA
jgi:hypothetical protein